MIELFLIVLLSLHLLVLLFVLGWISFEKREELPPIHEFPFVSILVAARNEEANILRCLRSLQELDYPGDAYEVLAGNDHSEDHTLALVEDFIKDKPHFKVFDIKEQTGTAKGKSNVLAQLARQAQGNYIFITDADIQLPDSWIKTLLPCLKDNTAIVTGSTIVKGRGDWTMLQEMEWEYLMGIFHTLDDIYPITAMGNNMAFLRKAYEEVGGYENLPFSITEDYQLMQEMRKLGYRHRQLLLPGCRGWSAPVTSFATLLKQRKRWIQGGKLLPWFIHVLSSLYGLFLPVFLLFLFFNLQAAMIFLAVKLFVDFLILLKICSRLKVPFHVWLLPLFEIYLPLVNVLSFLYSIMPGGVEWKGRMYEKS